MAKKNSELSWCCAIDKAWNGNFLLNKLKLILASSDMIYRFWRFNKLSSSTMWSVVFQMQNTINFNKIITLQKSLDADPFLYSFIHLRIYIYIFPNDLKTDVVLFPTDRRGKNNTKRYSLFNTKMSWLDFLFLFCFCFFFSSFGMQNQCRHVISVGCSKLSTIIAAEITFSSTKLWTNPQIIDDDLFVLRIMRMPFLCSRICWFSIQLLMMWVRSINRYFTINYSHFQKIIRRKTNFYILFQSEWKAKRDL